MRLSESKRGNLMFYLFTAPWLIGFLVFALWGLIIMTFWSVGAGMIIFLAGLQGVPSSLLEAARLDGADKWKTFWNVTFPMISPVFLFQLIMAVIESFQVFTQAYVMAKGGPNYSSVSMYLMYM